MNDCDAPTYYFVCFTSLVGIIIAAIAVDDLSFVFGMIAACSESLLNFVLPGSFFLSACSFVYGDNPKSMPLKIILVRFLAAIFTLTGVTYFVVSNYFNYIKFKRQV